MRWRETLQGFCLVIVIEHRIVDLLKKESTIDNVCDEWVMQRKRCHKSSRHQIFLFFYLVKTCEMNFRRTAQDPVDYNYGPSSVAIDDFNNDTWLDMVIANKIVTNIDIYFGNTNSTFSK